MGKIKSLIVTIIIMLMLWWIYELTDAYAWGAHVILSGFLTVAGFLFIGLAVYCFLRFGDTQSSRRKKQTWDVPAGGQWQR